MAEAIDVAKYLILLASREPERELISHLRLQKLLYYVQGWSLAVRKNPMFDEIIEAWRHGPVVREVYPHFAKYNNEAIPHDVEESSIRLNEQEKSFTKSIWESYKQYSAVELYRKTHEEEPYCNARGQLPPEANSDTEISQESMIRFFRDRYEQSATKLHGISLQSLWEAEKDVVEGKIISLDDAISKLGYASR